MNRREKLLEALKECIRLDRLHKVPEASYELVRGPQDGGKVRLIGGFIPPTIFVCDEPAKDGYIGYIGSEKSSKRFTHRYDMDDTARFIYRWTEKHE